VSGPVYVIPPKNGARHFCVYYNGLFNITSLDASSFSNNNKYPFPNVHKKRVQICARGIQGFFKEVKPGEK
jgi:hypothetical protein